LLSSKIGDLSQLVLECARLHTLVEAPNQGYVKLTARPRHHAQDTEALEGFKKGALQPNWKKSVPASRKAL
jgi:hypothetical protein